jgi:hypothetical protein
MIGNNSGYLHRLKNEYTPTEVLQEKKAKYTSVGFAGISNTEKKVLTVLCIISQQGEKGC